MSFNPDLTAIPGGAQTGFTSPTFDMTAGVAPGVNAKLFVVTNKGGTGLTNVRAHSISDPFSVMLQVPAVYKGLPPANPVSGFRGSIPRNQLFLKLVKGVQVAADMPAIPMVIRVSADIPAGADAYDAVNVRAAWSLLNGVLWEQSLGIGDTSINGIP